MEREMESLSTEISTSAHRVHTGHPSSIYTHTHFLFSTPSSNVSIQLRCTLGAIYRAVLTPNSCVFRVWDHPDMKGKIYTGSIREQDWTCEALIGPTSYVTAQPGIRQIKMTNKKRKRKIRLIEKCREKKNWKKKSLYLPFVFSEQNWLVWMRLSKAKLLHFLSRTLQELNNIKKGHKMFNFNLKLLWQVKRAILSITNKLLKIAGGL